MQGTHNNSEAVSRQPIFGIYSFLKERKKK
jgi:hypothetical protein